MARSRTSSGSSSSSSSSSSSDSSHRGSNKSKGHWWDRISSTVKGSNAHSSGSYNEAAQGVEAVVGIAQQLFFSEHTTMSSNNNNSRHGAETTPLLHRQSDEEPQKPANLKTRAIVWGILTLLFALALVFFLAFSHLLGDSLAPWVGILPRDPMLAALTILDNAPVISRLRIILVDLPILTRAYYANNVSKIDLLSRMPGHVDIPRLRQGKVGGFFWSTYVSCPNPELEGPDFLNSTWRVRDTLEQIDVSKLMIAKYPDTFQFALTSDDIKSSIAGGKIASLLGVEGGHQLGNSIAVLRQYYDLGVRYVTLTHTCHNAFADSCGYLPGIIPLHGGLSPLGRSLIEEMNRIGVLIDLSHTSDATAKQALNHSKAPVIWSHSSARAIHDVPRNVPDDVLQLIGTNKSQRDAVVMVNFAPFFVASPGNATVDAVADHVEHIGKVAGKKHVGLGSDFDGIGDVPVGLEDVSKYPSLIAELYRRGWSKYDLAGLTGGNLLRILSGAEKTAKDLQAAGTQPIFDLYDKRPDLPMSREDL
ncbi:membrane dipeptidase-domain-containing protein [Crucibulum laeve]|uniref:Dipeptidase n=1 Tax=Crucibulum laeve TaxID=68775 RepID=A0A5C3MGC7_9AGAR|nr:membrane dipeptidase-domain-containing protein [Crucibulum laeve]